MPKDEELTAEEFYFRFRLLRTSLSTFESEYDTFSVKYTFKSLSKLLLTLYILPTFEISYKGNLKCRQNWIFDHFLMKNSRKTRWRPFLLTRILGVFFDGKSVISWIIMQQKGCKPKLKIFSHDMSFTEEENINFPLNRKLRKLVPLYWDFTHNSA